MTNFLLFQNSTVLTRQDCIAQINVRRHVLFVTDSKLMTDPVADTRRRDKVYEPSTTKVSHGIEYSSTLFNTAVPHSHTSIVLQAVVPHEPTR
jgi:hypothetical protein